MVNYQFKTYIANGAEHYNYGADYGKDMMQTSKTVSFPESLLSLIDMDIDEIEPIIQELSETLWQLTTTREKQYAEDAKALLDDLTLRHICFQQFALDWKYRLSQALIFEQYTEDMLPRKYLYALPDTLRQMQGQIVELFENVLDTDISDEPISKRMVDYYKRCGETAFRFYPQPIGFELVSDDAFAEVLTPNNIYDILDFQLRTCVKQEVKMRRCKNCGRYFAVTGHGATEYCGRVADEKGRTCREVGAINTWTRGKQKDEVWKDYRREYKKRFARMRAGRLSSEDFYAWSKAAQEKKAAYDNGALAREAFLNWLAQSVSRGSRQDLCAK